MKKVFLLALAMVFASSAYATNVNKKINVSSFSGLDISSFFNVTVTKGGNEKVNITIDEELEPYLIAKVYGNTLRLGLDTDRMPDRMRRNMGDRTLEADITMSSLVKLEMSGAAKLTAEDTFKEREFEADFSGASKIHSLNIDAKEADFDISGASTVTLTLKVSNKADFDISGASDIYLVGEITQLEMEVSGAANAKISGTFSSVDLDCSGASKCTIKGTSISGKYDASGASNVDAENLEANVVNVDASGASKIDAYAKEYIGIELSGASSLHYTAAQGVNVDVKEVSRGCSMKRR